MRHAAKLKDVVTRQALALHAGGRCHCDGFFWLCGFVERRWEEEGRGDRVSTRPGLDVNGGQTWDLLGGGHPEFFFFQPSIWKNTVLLVKDDFDSKVDSKGKNGRNEALSTVTSPHSTVWRLLFENRSTSRASAANFILSRQIRR